MLHEILLSLSGLESPIWSQGGAAATGVRDQATLLNQYASPPERAMLETLLHLHDLNLQVRNTTTQLSRSHKSMVCRAVSASIADVHLGAFLDKIIQVESAILRKDAAYVGAYEIVPLSTVVAEFAPFTRRLEWLWSITQQLDTTVTSSVKAHRPCGAAILDLLDSETHTGYSDIEDMAIALLTVAQKAWMRAVSLWVLYGKLPTIGAEDFCIQKNPRPTSSMDTFVLDVSLTPTFVNGGARHCLLSAGNALSQLRSQSASGAVTSQSFNDPCMSLLQEHLTVLSSLTYPLNPSLLENALTMIDNGISQNALSQILPHSLVMRLLRVAWRYLLLGQGEFAVSLIANADDRVIARQHERTAALPVREVGKLHDLGINEAELRGILSKTMAELALIQADDDVDDDTAHFAKKVLSLKPAIGETGSYQIATLLPTPTLLGLTLPSKSPLHMFLSKDDAEIYANINAYLLSIHRAKLHLSALWKLTTLRRCHPSPLGPPGSASQSGKARLKAARQRDARRDVQIRRHWNLVSKLLFLVNELQVFLQGEVVESSWTQFRMWLERGGGAQAPSAKSSRPGTASSNGQPGAHQSHTENAGKPPSDPRAVSAAHRTYLRAMYAALFLANDPFTALLNELLTQIDHVVALFSRLQAVWQGLDLQEDEGVVDAFSNYVQDEKEVLGEMNRTREGVEALLSELVEQIRSIEKEKRTGVGINSGVRNSIEGMTLNSNVPEFVPWQARTVDRLVMKLDGLSSKKDDHSEELINGYDDD